MASRTKVFNFWLPTLDGDEGQWGSMLNENWEAVEQAILGSGGGGGGGIPDAPGDGRDYVRKDGQWVVASYFSGEYGDLLDVPKFADVAFSGEYGDILNTPPPFVPTTFDGAGTTGYVDDPAVEREWFLRDDGTFRPAPLSPIGALFINYQYDIGTGAADPGPGRIGANSTDSDLITEVYANGESAPGNDVSFIWENLDPGEYLGVWETESDRESLYFVVTGPVVNNGGWFTIPVDRIAGTDIGGIENDRAVQVFFIANPNEKVPQGGTVGQVLTKITNDNYDDGWRTPGFIYDGDDVVSTNTGNVGIGTTNPLELMHLYGVGAALLIQDSNAGLSTATPTIKLAESGAAGVVDNSWEIGTNHPDGVTNFSLDFSYNTVLRMSMAATGEIYIPIGPLLIGSLKTEEGVTEMLTVNDTGQVGKQAIPVAPATYWGLSDDDIYNTNPGNVGIGVTDPSRKLQASSSEGVVASLIGTNGNGRSTIGFQGATTTGGDNQVVLGALGNDFILQTTAATRLTVKGTTGYVGIGLNPSPSASLHVQYPDANGQTMLNHNNGGTNYFDASGSTVWRGVGAENRMLLNHSSGAFQLFGLAGTGDRMVICNSSGVLGSQAIPSGGDNYFTQDVTHTYITDTSQRFSVGDSASGRFLHVKSPQAIVGDFTSTGATARISLVASGTSNDGQVGIGAADNDLQLFSAAANRATLLANGDFVANGNVTGYSDERLKQDKQDILMALDKVAALNAFTYRPNALAVKLGAAESEDEVLVGLSAQDVEAVMPEVIKPAAIETLGEGPTGEDYKTVQYERLVPLLVAAIQELTTEVEVLKERLGGVTR